jgi:hypothetical protein
MSEVKTTEVVVKLVDILAPLSTEDRWRVVKASLTLLGDEPANAQGARDLKVAEDEGTLGLPPRARQWLNQNSIGVDEIQQVFHLAEGAVDVIATEIPGKSDKDKTYNAYILTGIGNLLAKGEASFSDKAARDVCKSAGCLNAANHSVYIRDKGNEFTGTKEKGWMLTAPGLKRGAVIIKQLSGEGK